LHARGHKDVEVPAGPQRWVRRVLRVRGREITVEVNSQQRLTRLLDILRKAGGNPVVTSEKRIDPAQDFAWSAVQRAAPGGAAAAAEGWEKFWLDEQIPALSGRTPRQAARGRERPYLQAMLRQFEYEPTSWPPMARPASTPPGCAGNSTCHAISPTERPDNRPALATAHSLLQPALAVRQVLIAGIFGQLRFKGGDDSSGVCLGAPVGAWHEDHAEVSRAAWCDRVGVERPVVAQVVGDHGPSLGPGQGHHLGI
jgi:hypothetical protein